MECSRTSTIYRVWVETRNKENAMIHDLSLDGIFRKEINLLDAFGIIPSVKHHITPERHYEALLTGDAYERESKRFMIDYETEQCICDRCGDTITRKPWDFQESKLCIRCEAEFEKEMEDKRAVENLLLSDEMISEIAILSQDGTYFVPSVKAWDMAQDDDTPKPTDNIFLWD